MVKSSKEVIAEWNKQINMTAEELDKWLQSAKSKKAGWSKGDGSGEAIGHESGRKIVEILKKNPSKDPDKYDEHDIEHMRRVVAYNKRHLAQESKLKGNEDYENSKSFISLMNWGHNPLKGQKERKAPTTAKGGKKGKQEEAGKGDKDVEGKKKAALSKRSSEKSTATAAQKRKSDVTEESKSKKTRTRK